MPAPSTLTLVGSCAPGHGSLTALLFRTRKIIPNPSPLILVESGAIHFLPTETNLLAISLTMCYGGEILPTGHRRPCYLSDRNKLHIQVGRCFDDWFGQFPAASESYNLNVHAAPPERRRTLTQILALLFEFIMTR
jgi:hypothetical protein